MTRPASLVTEARNATLPDLLAILTDQRARSLDVVAGSAGFGVRQGQLVLSEIPAIVDESGVRQAEQGGTFRPLRSFDYNVAQRLGIPLQFLRTMRETRPDVYDALVNGLLHGGTDADGTTYPADPSKFLIRMFRGDPGQPGVVRALLSNGYKPIDNLDILATAMSTVNEMRAEQVRTALSLDPAAEVGEGDLRMFTEMYPGGAPGLGGGYEIRNVQLTEDSMRIRIVVPGVTGVSKAMTDGYRNPFRDGGARRADGYQPPARPRPKQGDIVCAFVDFVNNEVGTGSYQILPGYEVCICDNGQTVPKWAIRTPHVGSRLEEGMIQWSEETRQAALRLVMNKTRDALRKFLSPGFLQTVIAETEKRADVPVSDPAKTIEVVAKECDFTDAQAADILRMFTLGGQLSAAGIANAVTAAAQVQASPEAAIRLEYQALTALEAAADYAAATVKEVAPA
jgi:hypothetical protein